MTVALTLQLGVFGWKIALLYLALGLNVARGALLRTPSHAAVEAG